MASYFEVTNDNNKIVIDDTYENLSFVHTSEVITVQAADERNVNGNGWQNLSDGAYGRYETYSRVYLFGEVGIIDGGKVPSYLGIRQIGATEQNYTQVSVYTVFDTVDTSKAVGFKYRIYSMIAGAQYQVVSYTDLENRVPSKEGLQIYNENRKLVFDAALGFLQVMDSQYHKRDLYSSAVETFEVYNSTLPGIDFDRVFLIPRQRPYAMTGGTIITNFRQYVPRLRKDLATGKIYVDLAMWGKTGGSRLQQYQYVFSFMVAYVQF